MKDWPPRHSRAFRLRRRADLVERRTKEIHSFIERHEREKDNRNNIRISAVIVSVVAFISLFALAIFSSRLGFTADYIVPVLQIPLPIFLWSAIGGFTSILYRFNKAGDSELQDPLRWLITRPLTGIVMGIISYLVVKTGFLTAGAEVIESIQSNELVWLIAFLAGFSDRFSDSVLKSLVGKFGGDKESGVITPVSSSPKFDIVELMKPKSKGKKEPSSDGEQSQKVSIPIEQKSIRLPNAVEKPGLLTESQIGKIAEAMNEAQEQPPEKTGEQTEESSNQ